MRACARLPAQLLHQLGVDPRPVCWCARLPGLATGERDGLLLLLSRLGCRQHQDSCQAVPTEAELIPQ